MANERKLNIVIAGDAKGGVDALNKTEGAAGKLASKVAGVGKAMAAGLAVGAGAITAFGVKSAGTFKSVGGEVSKLSRLTGLAAEDASKLRFAAKQSGIGVDVLSRSVATLSKNSSGKNLDKLKLGLKDAKGQALPLNKQLLILADRFSKMPAGAEKNAMALKVFGKSGLELLPFLNKGAAGIEELTGQAAKFGQVLSQDNLDAIKKNTAAHRDFDAAMEGLQLQVGQYVLPVLTHLVTFATSALMPAIQTVGGLARDYLAPAFSWAFGVAEKVMGSAVAFATDVLYPGVRKAVDRIVEVVTPFAKRFADVWEKGRKAIEERLLPALNDKLMPVLRKVAGFINDNLGTALVGLSAGVGAVAIQALNIGSALGGVIQTIAVLPFGLTAIVVGIAALVAGLIYAYKHSERFREVVDGAARVLREKFGQAVEWVRRMWPGFKDAVKDVIDYLRTNVLPVVRQVADYIVEQFGNAVAWFKSIWPQVQEAVTHVMNVVRDIITVVVNIVSALWRAWGDDIWRMVKTVWEGMRSTIENVLTIIRNTIEFVLAIINGDWGKAWDALKGIVSGVWDEVKNTVSTGLNIVRGLFAGAVSTIGQVFAGVADVILWPFKTAFNAIATIWNNTIGKLSFHVPSWVPGIGGKGFDVPNIPTWDDGGGKKGGVGRPFGKGFAAGGFVDGPAGRDVIPARLSRGEFVMRQSAVDRIGTGALAALNAGAPLASGNAVVVNIHAPIPGDEMSFRRWLVAQINEAMRQGHALQPT